MTRGACSLNLFSRAYLFKSRKLARADGCGCRNLLFQMGGNPPLLRQIKNFVEDGLRGSHFGDLGSEKSFNFRTRQTKGGMLSLVIYYIYI